MENYSSLIRLTQKVKDSELSDVCVIVKTVDTAYPFAFIEFEDDESLGIFYTAEDFSERFIVLNKEAISDDDFLGNVCEYQFYIHEEALHEGNNLGCIRFTHCYGSFEIAVSVDK